jgi:hypothetical protein
MQNDDGDILKVNGKKARFLLQKQSSVSSPYGQWELETPTVPVVSTRQTRVVTNLVLPPEGWYNSVHVRVYSMNGSLYNFSNFILSILLLCGYNLTLTVCLTDVT